VWYDRNTLTNYVEVTKAGGTATITKVVFYRDVLGAAFTLLNTLTAAPFKVGFSVSDLDVNTVVNVVAAVTCSDGNVVYMTFSGRVREPNLSPTDIRVTVSTIQVRRLSRSPDSRFLLLATDLTVLCRSCGPCRRICPRALCWVLCPPWTPTPWTSSRTT
jgi:hypothetical protein